MSSVRSLAVLVAAQIIPAVACSSTQVARRPDLLPPKEGMAEAQAITQLFAGRDVEVRLSRSQAEDSSAGPSVRTGRLVPLDGKSYFLSEPPNRSHGVRFADTHSITSKDRVKGANRGLLIGALAGAVGGALFGAVISGMGCSDMGTHIQCPSQTGPMLGGAAVGSLLVGIIGAGVGASTGYRTTLTF